MAKYVVIFGREPALAFAELTRLFARGDATTGTAQLLGSVAVVSGLEASAAVRLPELLGGTVKVAEVLGQITNIPKAHDVSPWLDILLPQVTRLRPATFGISYYTATGQAPGAQAVEKIGLSIKRHLKTLGVSGVRWVNGRGQPLTSVQVTGNKLTQDKNAEFIVVIGDEVAYIARTVAVQPYEAWGKRDYGRPRRNARAGMLPPKLARAMVNLLGMPMRGTLLDPFCGSGTVLMEALLAGWQNVVGTDIAKLAVTDSAANIDWLREHTPVSGEVKLFTIPVPDLATVVPSESVQGIVTEVALGPPCAARPNEKSVAAMKEPLLPLYSKALESFAAVLIPGGRAVIAFPVWETDEGSAIGVIADLVLDMAMFRVIPFPDGAQTSIYRRPGQAVGREIIVLEKPVNN
ncbi:MAG: hypothetical protein WC052_01695 [Patescibacteria group bacterium]